MVLLHQIIGRNSNPSKLNIALLAAIYSLFVCTQCLAGHGLMNAFSDINWLPEAGVTPDEFYYQTDKIAESVELSLKDTPEKKFYLLASHANERLAEMDRMVFELKVEAAEEAILGYKIILEQMASLVVEGSNSMLADSLTNQLLENQYIISSQYLDYPKSTRNLVFSVKKAAEDTQEKIDPMVSTSLKGSLFFKTEEIRWSWATAIRADEQGL